ncbi:hypothetical protein Hamer_G000381 [Homarus americanus]|uniref:Uncharacterized protein n=1 Tax=Homarus americanus TaxID=6706 RepID=A0A8J5NCJ9_HOMAM|nr:hypothetical protein Hamer_G000381 [Homarus americanus]
MVLGAMMSALLGRSLIQGWTREGGGGSLTHLPLHRRFLPQIPPAACVPPINTMTGKVSPSPERPQTCETTSLRDHSPERPQP